MRSLRIRAMHEHVHRARDGWRLSTMEVAPPAGAPRAVVVLGHAMMVDRRTMASDRRDSLAAHLAARGWSVLVPDLRGHGESGPTARAGGRWSYDDLVGDCGEYVSLARELHPDLPIAFAGHSLFGHAALAWLGQHPDAPVHAHVSIAANWWRRSFNHGKLRWLEKSTVMEMARAAVRLVGGVPAATLGLGTFDEPAAYWRTLDDGFRNDRWVGGDRTDYHAGLARVSCPVLVVVSDGDRVLAAPDDTLAFTASLSDREVLRVGHPSSPPPLHALAPGHMGLVTDPRSAPVWDAIAEWLERALGIERRPH